MLSVHMKFYTQNFNRLNVADRRTIELHNSLAKQPSISNNSRVNYIAFFMKDK